MTKFKRTSAEPYITITPLSPLSELEEFLKSNIFALGQSSQPSQNLFILKNLSLVTDQNRKFVLAVATSQDLESFVSRRGR